MLGNDAKGLPGLSLTPAQVEQLSAEHDDVKDMVAALEAKALGVVTVSDEIDAPAGGSEEDSEEAVKVASPPKPERQGSKTKVVFE